MNPAAGGKVRMAIRFLSLFAGIGGFDLGLERAGWQCVGQVEIDPFCRRVLAKHWPNVVRFEDVREVTGELVRERCGDVDAIVGGFPCQDISFAGAGAGLDGERSGLWKELYRIICELRPRIALMENVAALLNRGIDRVLADLARIGYDAEWSIVSVCSMGAPHMRRRLFIVAYPNSLFRRESVRYFENRENAIQAIDRFESARADYAMRMANASELYRDIDGVPFGLDRARAVGNAVAPDVAQWIGERINESFTEALQ